jgi:hypothetical protein
MRAFKSAKVLIIDDTEEDGYAILKSLWNRGVGAVYLTGKKEEFPESPLKGIRLAILDMVLVLDDPKPVSTLISVLKNVIDNDNGPYIAIAWTKHPEIAQEFADRIDGNQTWAAPQFVQQLEKIEVKDIETGKFDSNKIAQKILTHLSQIRPFDFMLQWEQKAMRSAQETINRLSDIGTQVSESGNLPSEPAIESERERWQISLTHILATLAKKQHGKTLTDGGATIESICQAMNPLVFDQLEDQTLDLVSEYVNTGSDISSAGNNTPDELVECFSSDIMGMFHTAHPNITGKEPHPGDVYLYRGIFTKSDPAPMEDILKHLFGSASSQYAKSIDENKNRILLEITPLCDKAQGRMRIGRCVPGIVAPAEGFKDKFKNREYTLKLGPIRNLKVPLLEEPCYIAFDFVFIFGIPLDALRIGDPPASKAIFRLRNPFLARVQTLFGSHALRQGVFEI